MRRFDSARQVRWCRNVRSSTDLPPNTCDVAFEQDISARLRSIALSHEDLYCQMCGVVPGDIDDLTGRTANFHIGRIKAKKLGGEDALSSLRTLCSTCYRGAEELYKEMTSAYWLPPQASQAEQHAKRPVLSALLKEIGEAK
jgi:hypothetical protein